MRHGYNIVNKIDGLIRLVCGMVIGTFFWTVVMAFVLR